MELKTVTVIYDVGGIDPVKDDMICEISNQFEAMFVGSGCWARGERDFELLVEADKADAMVAALRVADASLNVSVVME
jgi:hypothetical protein